MQKTTLGDRYRLLDTLGGGGMAKVYLARDEVLHREVAVKVLREQFNGDDEFIERFRREARSAASLRHPNIVQIFDQGEADDGSHFMAMEYIPGGTLKDRILDRSRLTPGEAAEISLKVAEALGAAHEKGVVHRDIKPQNVLLTETGEPKVADFGIARAASAATISQTSRVLGTAGYMSPEQALGEKAGPESDLYSLGIVLYEMLVGALPYEADTPVAVAVKHINEPPMPPGEIHADIPPTLGAITLKLLSKNPDDRYPDAQALADDLRRVLDGLPPKGVEAGFVPPAPRREDDAPTTAFRPESPPSRPPRRGKRGGAMRTAVAVVAGLLLLGGVVFAAIEAPWENSGETAPVAESETPSGEDQSPEENAESAPEPPEVPDVVGLSEAEARESLAREGFEIRVNETESSASEEGNVVRQSVAAGEGAERGSEVGITVGSGPSTVEVPEVTTEAEAVAQLEVANLQLGSVTYSSSDEPSGVVTSQNPAPGTEVEEDESVDIVVSTGPEVVAPEPEEEVEPEEPVEREPNTDEPNADESELERPSRPSNSQPSQAPSGGSSSDGSPSGGTSSGGTSSGESPSMADEIVSDTFDDVGIE